MGNDFLEIPYTVKLTEFDLLAKEPDNLVGDLVDDFRVFIRAELRTAKMKAEQDWSDQCFADTLTRVLRKNPSLIKGEERNDD